jgi:threonine aldolase
MEIEAPIERWLESARPTDAAAQSNPSLCCFENTHNRLGGGAASAKYCNNLAAALREKCGVKLHLDGARILYAAAALRTSPSALAAPFDTVSISLNKGLGAPIAAALAGTGQTIKLAERIRQRLGGGIRPVAAGAAASLVALEDVSHLEEDIRRAKFFAKQLSSCPHLDFSSWPVTSNLVFFAPIGGPGRIAEFSAKCADEGLLLTSSPTRLRASFYRGITDADVEQSIRIVERVLL